MMQRIWAAICTAWAVIAVFAVLAVTHRQAGPSSSAANPVVLVRSANGSLVPVSLPGGAHATTQSSQVGVGTVVQGASGLSQTGSYPTTRSS
jgi:hypothetical protein